MSVLVHRLLCGGLVLVLVGACAGADDDGAAPQSLVDHAALVGALGCDETAPGDYDDAIVSRSDATGTESLELAPAVDCHLAEGFVGRIHVFVPDDATEGTDLLVGVVDAALRVVPRNDCADDTPWVVHAVPWAVVTGNENAATVVQERLGGTIEAPTETGRRIPGYELPCTGAAP